MTPKEKAIELVERFHNDGEVCGQYFTYEMAKKQTLICVDEFLDFMNNLIITEGSLAYQYWSEVKQEINKL